MDKVTIRPHFRVGAASFAFGIWNLFMGLSKQLNEPFGAFVGAIFDKSTAIIMLLFGIWLIRKRIVLGDKDIRLVGLIKGRADLKIDIDQIESIGFNYVMNKLEIATPAEKYYADVSEKSEAHYALGIRVKPKISGDVDHMKNEVE